MNRNCHCIIFNASRGQLMVVAETAQGGGKSASGESQSCIANSQAPTWVSRYRHTMLAAWLVCGILPMALAQVIADPTAPANQRPTVLSDSAGRPLVNIQTPSAAGLSRNTYKQFDVPSTGIVLNNSAANPWLSNGILAKTILNEVNATSQSYINGTITVNGGNAQVIVANPSGITINGGSFVNASRATLTTGTAQVTNGALTGFNIRGGGVTVGSGGFNNSATPYTDIMSRAVSVVGQLRAQNLGITTGLQTVAYDTGLISNQDTNTYAAGALTIDTAALGGMYANNISILATEAGLGVRNQGTWQASGGQIVVTADGILQNLGTVSAEVVSLATLKGNIENTGSVQGAQALILSAGGDARLFGVGLKQSAGSAVVISAAGAVNLFNTTTYGAAQVASTATGGQVSISAGQNITLQSGTAVAANKDVQLSSDAMVVVSSASVTSSAGNVTALAGTGIALSNSTVTGQQVHLETGAAFKDTVASVVVIGGNVRGQTQTTLLATDSILVQSPGSTAVSGGSNVHIQATNAVDITAGSTVTAGQHMSVMAGTSVNLQATSGSTATNGQKVTLSAGGNMLVSANTVTATGSSLSAVQDLDIEANNGNANLNALYNAGGTSVNKLNLSAGKDLNVSAFKGSLYISGLQASGQNIALMSNGTTSVANATIKNGSNTQAVASTLTARDDLVVGSINTTAGASSQVQVVASSLTAGGQVKVLSNGVALITAATDTVNSITSPARSSITAGSVAIQGGSVQTDAADIRTNGDKSTTAKSGDITVTATSGNALFNVHTNIRSQFNSTGNIALHANGNLTHWYTQANAGGGLSSTSATGQINGTGANLVAKDVLSLASKGAQTHTSGYYSAGAASVFNETGNLALNSTRVQAVGTTTTGMSVVSGQTSIESGGTLGIDAGSVLIGTTDLSIIQGQGDITINPTTASRGTLAWSQTGVNRNLTLATRNGNVNFTGSAGTNGVGSSSNVGLYVKGDFNLVGNSVNLQGTRLQTGGALNITATSGDLTTRALQVDQTVAGYKNTYWDYVQLVGGTGVNVKAAGNIAMDSVYAQSNASVNIQSGGNTTIAGNYAHYTVNNQASGGWYQDARYLWRSVINGNTGVNIGAMGGSLTLSAADVFAAKGKASLQALGAINLQAAQEYRLDETSRSGSDTSCFLWIACSTTNWTNYYHNEYLTNKPINVTAQDIEIKAGNSISTYGTKFSAGRNLTLEAGDAINYFAVTDQKLETAKRDERTGWGIGGLFSINVGSGSYANSLRQLSGQPTTLQSQGDILSNSGGNQLLQGTKVSYAGTAAFNASVGEKARADARIILEGIKNTTTQARTSEANYVVWQTQLNQGTSQETLVLPSFTGPSKPTFSAPGGLIVQIPDGNFKSQIQTLSTQPGMGYLNDLAARKDVNWQPVKLAYETWNYQQEGLTPAGAGQHGHLFP
jgi:filamentous hemagglutinin